MRLNGVPALDFWDLTVSVPGSVSQISDRTGRPVNVDVERNQKSQGKMFPQTSNLRVKKLCCMCVKTTKQ